MDIFHARLENIYTDGRLPAYHVARYTDGQVFDPVTQTFSTEANLPVADNVVVPMVPGTGLLTALYTADITVTASFTDGWYVVYYHDLLLPGHPVFTWDVFQVYNGQCELYTIKDLAVQIVSQIAAINYSLDATAG